MLKAVGIPELCIGEELQATSFQASLPGDKHVLLKLFGGHGIVRIKLGHGGVKLVKFFQVICSNAFLKVNRILDDGMESHFCALFIDSICVLKIYIYICLNKRFTTWICSSETQHRLDTLVSHVPHSLLEASLHYKIP